MNEEHGLQSWEEVAGRMGPAGVTQVQTGPPLTEVLPVGGMDE